MSSIVAFPTNGLTLNSSNGSTYGTVQSGLSFGSNTLLRTNSSDERAYTLNAAGKSLLYPNSTAHPVKADLKFAVHRQSSLVGAITSNGRIRFDGANIIYGGQASTSSKEYSTTGDTNAAITSSTLNSTLQVILFTGLATTEAYLDYAYFKLYFTRYDFSASAGTGIASATVDKSTGYDGDTVTFTASVQNGYAFDGWYNGASKVSDSQTYVHTANGSDISLTAKAVSSETKTVTTKYNGTTIATEGVTPPVAVSYNGAQIASIADGAAKILSCGGKLMSGNVVVGGKTLQCKDKIMSGDVLIIVGADINILDGKTWSLSNVTLTDGVFSFATGATAMAQASLPKPIANHLYYGRVEERRMPECTSIADGRFEYYAGDGTNKNMVFSTLGQTPNDGQWHTKSQILSMDAPIDGDWKIRNFTVSANGACYRRNPVLVDLTATFGAGHEPDLAWCDTNL